jgi:hypothetical protein
MQPHLSNLQFIVAVVAFAFVAVLALASLIDIRRRRTPPFLNYFYSDFDPDQYDRDTSRQASFSGLDEWRAYNRSRAQVYEARATTHHGSWD